MIYKKRKFLIEGMDIIMRVLLICCSFLVLSACSFKEFNQVEPQGAPAVSPNTASVSPAAESSRDSAPRYFDITSAEIRAKETSTGTVKKQINDLDTTINELRADVLALKELLVLQQTVKRTPQEEPFEKKNEYAVTAPVVIPVPPVEKKALPATGGQRIDDTNLYGENSFLGSVQEEMPGEIVTPVSDAVVDVTPQVESTIVSEVVNENIPQEVRKTGSFADFAPRTEGQVLAPASAVGAAVVAPAVNSEDMKKQAPALAPVPELAKAPEPKAAPKKKASYEKALQLVRDKEFVAARNEFLRFVDEDPENKLVPNALYWLGETYYAQVKYPDAILQFKDVVAKYPKSPKKQDALLKIAMSYDNLNDKENARFYYSIVIREFPTSRVADIARNKMRDL